MDRREFLQTIGMIAAATVIPTFSADEAMSFVSSPCVLTSHSPLAVATFTKETYIRTMKDVSNFFNYHAGIISGTIMDEHEKMFVGYFCNKCGSFKYTDDEEALRTIVD